jgi:hypothetical protein
MKNLGPDGAVYVENDLPTTMQNGKDGARWVVCNGAIVARAYVGPELQRVYERTSSVVI